ncbi:hypothetical protein GCM10027590_16970 [Nocardiopsis nanhaiensis]
MPGTRPPRWFTSDCRGGADRPERTPKTGDAHGQTQILPTMHPTTQISHRSAPVEGGTESTEGGN